ncbi:MAG TPA: hypothetical protein VK094_00090 [Pseudogracilibacillus sp.]|nr:hypothetical protein [Pseudogracilibacillus sp.]
MFSGWKKNEYKVMKDFDKKMVKKKEKNVRKIKETKCTCNACGNIWYYGKAEKLENTGDKLQSAGNSMSNAGKDMMCCTGCLPALFIPPAEEKKVKDLDQCSDCGSKAVKKEVVEHVVE